jgi:AAHS family 4-hydroxybenzoate transporter-like MFS transporter
VGGGVRVGGALPLLLLPVIWLALPESARFLAIRHDAEIRLAPILRQIDPSIAPSTFIAQVRHEGREQGPRRFPVGQLFQDGRARTTVLLWTAFFMNLLVMYFLVNWLQSLLRGLGLSMSIAIVSTAILNFGGVLGALALGRLIDRHPPALVLGIAYAASAIFIVVIAYAGSHVGLLLVGAGLAGFGIVGGQIGLNAVTATAYPTTIRATAVGWALGIGRVGSILGPVAGGAMLALGWSGRELLLAVVAPALIASAAAFLLRTTWR